MTVSISGFKTWLAEHRDAGDRALDYGQILALVDTPVGCAVTKRLAGNGTAVVRRPATGLAVLPTEEELQRRVRPLGWDVETLAPDLAVPLVSFKRRDGAVHLTVQKAGRGWSLELVHEGKHGESYLLRFTRAKDGSYQVAQKGGSTELPTIDDALRIAAQVIAENGPKVQITTTTASWYEPSLSERVEVEIGVSRRGVVGNEVRAYGKTFTLRQGRWDKPPPVPLLKALQGSSYGKHFPGVGEVGPRVVGPPPSDPGDWSVDIPADVPPERRAAVEKLREEIPGWLKVRSPVWVGARERPGGTWARWTASSGAFEVLVQSGAGIHVQDVRVQGRFVPEAGPVVVGPRVDSPPDSLTAERVFPDGWILQLQRRVLGLQGSRMETMPVQGRLFELPATESPISTSRMETMPAPCPPTEGSIFARGFPKETREFYRATARRGTPTKSKKWGTVANSAIPLLQQHGVVIGPLLGCGKFGCAYEIQGERKRVAKFTGDPADAVAWQMVLETVGGRAWPEALVRTECVEVVPQVVTQARAKVAELDEVVVTDAQRRMFFMIQERMGPLTAPEVAFFNSKDVISEVLGAGGVWGKGSRAKVMGMAVAAGISWEAVSELVAAVRWLKKHEVIWHDLHGGNVMASGRGAKRRFKIVDLGYSEAPSVRIPVMAEG